VYFLLNVSQICAANTRLLLLLTLSLYSVLTLYLNRLTDWQNEVTSGLGLRGKKKPKVEVSSRAIRRLTLRGGVTRIQLWIMPYFKLNVKLYLENIVKDAIVLAYDGGSSRESPPTTM